MTERHRLFHVKQMKPENGGGDIIRRDSSICKNFAAIIGKNIQYI